MENNSYTNVLDNSKSATPPVYTCGLCSEEFMYYRDLAVHERMHLEQITGSLQAGVRPPYENRPGLYNTPSTAPPPPSSIPLESFDKLVQPFRRESVQRGQLAQTNIRSPLPINTAQDKPTQIYRSDVEARNVLLDNRAGPLDRTINMDLRGLPVEDRALPLDTRPVTQANRISQPANTRAMMPDGRSVPIDSRSVPYNTSSYMDPGINSTLYSSELTNKLPVSVPQVFPNPQPTARTEHYGAIENRQQGLPKLDSQIFSKPEPYYGLPKTHYSSHGVEDKSHSNYTPASQYGPISKLLSQPPVSYYTPPMVGQPQSKYNMEKLASPSAPSLGYYNQPGMSQADPKLDRRQPSPSPKQTLYYGQPQTSSPHPTTLAGNPHFTVGLPKPSPVPFQAGRELGNKYLEKGEFGLQYQSGHVSPHLTYTDTYKGSSSSSQAQPQAFPAVPSQPAPAQQHNYPYYKAPPESVPNVNINSKPASVEALGIQECECYICFAPFPNMNELSEHMKIHARENIAKELAAQLGHQQQHHQQVPGAALMGTSSPAVTLPYPGVTVNPQMQPAPLPSSSTAFKPTRDNLTCRICDKTFLKLALLVEHVETHKVQKPEQYECKVCKKSFSNKHEYTKHEVLHQKELRIFFCEMCKKDFSFMGNYLHHMQVEHNKTKPKGTVNKAGDKAKITPAAEETPVSSVGDTETVACQICEMKMEKDKLVDHLKYHPVYTCDKCECSFIQKLEYVEHLMEDHWKELAESSENSDGEERDKSDRVRERSEEKDSGLEEDHEKDKEDGANVRSKAKGLAKKAKRVAEASANKDAEKQKNIQDMKNLKENREKKLIEDSSNESSIVKDTKLKFSCSKCEESFERKTDLAQHVEVHKRDPTRIYCEVCNLSYNYREKGYLTYHMKQHTDEDLIRGKGPDMLMCTVCYKEIKREAFVSHIVDQHTSYSCDLCQWSYSSESSLFIHMKKIHSSSKVKYILKKGGGIEVQHKTVPVVYKKLKDVAPGDEDDLGSPRNTFTCKVCSKVFGKKSSIENHMKKHREKTGDQNEECEICNSSFTNKGAYFYHVTHEHETVDDVKPQTYKDTPKVDSVKVETKPNETKLITETKTITVLNPETGNLEEKVVDSENGVESEISEPKLDNDSKEATSKTSSDVVSEIMYCKLCNKCLKRGTLYSHLKEHNFFHCELCKFSFTKRPPYLHHRKMLHVEDLVSGEVEKVEGEERALVKATESGKRKRTDLNKLLTCPVCSAEFRQDKYIEHIKTHKRVAMKCRFCDREFSKKNLLAVHEKSHERITHVENELPFARNCPVCNAGIVSRANYVQHVCEHLDHLPLACKLCGQQFIGEKILENHKRVYHDANLRVYWTQDGEGLRFDMRTGRYGEVASDYISEIKELNELLKQNNKPEIWVSTTPKKLKGTVGRPRKYAVEEDDDDDDESDDENDSDEDEEDESGADKADTSDEDYVPGKKAKTYTSDKDNSDADYKPSSKKKKKKKLVYTADDESTSEEEKANKTRSKRQAAKASKKAAVKSRKMKLRKKQKPIKKFVGGRVLRSRFKSEKESSDNGSEESNSEDSSSHQRPKRKAASKPSEEDTPRPKRQKKTPEELLKEYKLKPSTYPKKCPLCAVRIHGPKHYGDHLRMHAGEKPFECPVCKWRFTREWNMYTHIQSAHKDYHYVYPQEHAHLSIKVDESPSTSTPIKTPKVTVQLSPLQLDENTTIKTTPKGSSTGNKDSTEKRQVLYICKLCNKQTNNSWNLSRHMTIHKEELEKAEEESKPFSCKTCSESFKKKRDLYIHTKIHTGTTVEGDEDLDVSKTESEMNDTENTSLSGSVHESDLPHSKNLSNSMGDISRNGNNVAMDTSNCVSGQNDNSSVNPDPKNNNNPMKLDRSETVNKVNNIGDVSDNKTTSSNIPQTNSQTTAASHSLGNNGVSVPNNQSNSSDKVSMETDDCENSNSGVRFEVPRRNSNSDLKRLSDSEMEDKTKSTKTPPPVKKMTSDSALSKWKMKVRATLSSQLELNAAKKQEEMENPEIARVKEKLAIKPKSEKKNFECRICGIAFDLENLFRQHMDVHLNEAPPYCALCDIYFMAIYPKRRLLEHNRKKHPELQS